MTAPLADKIVQLKLEAEQALSAAGSAADLERWRVKYLGRKGQVPLFLRGIKGLAPEDRRQLGQQGNRIRQDLEQAFAAVQRDVSDKTTRPLPLQPAASLRSFTRRGTICCVPPKLYAKGDNLQPRLGHLHPLTLALRDLQRIFSDLGFLLVEGPNVEESRLNFDELNIPFEHPARAETDTFYLRDFPDLVLRTHVSPLQIRGVEENNLRPPFRIMYSGSTYRAEKEDATHGSLFQQYEFMVVDDAVNLADLKAIISTVYSRFFGADINVRFRPSYFPFVEPGLEVDMEDKITSKGGWLEMAGAGLVHPNVLRSINVDPDKYQGIALGGGLDRLAMLKYGIPDIRLFYANGFNFLRQF